MRHYNRWQLFSAFHPGQYDEERLTIQEQVFSSVGQSLGDVVRMMVQPVGVYTPEYHFFLGTASQEGLMTGATDVSMPVGSGRFRDHAQDPRGVLSISFPPPLLLGKRAVWHTLMGEHAGLKSRCLLS